MKSCKNAPELTIRERFFFFQLIRCNREFVTFCDVAVVVVVLVIRELYRVATHQKVNFLTNFP